MAAPTRHSVRKKLLGQIFKDMRILHEGQIQEALQTQKKDGGQIGQILVRLGHIDQSQLQMALGTQSGMEVVDLSSMEPQADARVPKKTSVAATTSNTLFNSRNVSRDNGRKPASESKAGARHA